MKQLLVALCAAACAACDTSGRDVSTGAGLERPGALSIAAASDLRYALDELARAFGERHGGIGTAVSYGSSGNLHAQIVNGAPFDLFLSADVAYARDLEGRGAVRPGSVFTYAEGRLVVWVPNVSALDIERRGLAALTDSSIAHVAIANPEHAPYGRAAEAVLRAAGHLDQVKPKLVLGENISQTLQFVQSGAAQAGIVALSLALAPPVASTGRYWVVPADMHSPIEQGGAVLQSAQHVEAAEAFRAFLIGEEGRAILERYGFTVP